MILNDLQALLPLLVLAATPVVALLTIAFYRNHLVTAGLTLGGLAASFVLLVAMPPSNPRPITPLLVLDPYAAFFIGLILAATAAVLVLSYGYLKRQEGQHEEFYALLAVAALGSAVLAASSHFASLFLGLEILSVSLYTLLSYVRTRYESVEAGVKYLILASVSSAFLLFGMALVYADLGTMELARLAALAAPGTAARPLLLTGLGLLVVGIGFKLAVVPFHMWTADVYEGAPAPVTAFLATVSKGAVFALLLRFATLLDLQSYRSLWIALALIAIASMIAGNLLALLQRNVKRLLAYSSIAHLGYLLAAFLAGGRLGATAAVFYLVAYTVTTLTTFGLIAVLSGQDPSAEGDAERLEDFRGLFWQRPWLAALMTVALLSLMGIPLTAGFVGKFYVVAAGVGAAQWVLVGSLLLASAIGLYYYLRVIVAMVSDRPAGEPIRTPSLTLAGSAVLAVLGLLLVWLGVYPAPLIALIERTVGAL